MGWQQKKEYEVKREQRVTLSSPYPPQCWFLAPVAHIRSRQDRFPDALRFSDLPKRHNEWS